MIKYFKNPIAERLNNGNIKISFDNDLEGKTLSIYYSDDSNFQSNKKLLLETTSNSIEFEDPLKSVRTYFLLEANNFDSEIIAERVLPLEGACNFRDLGGLKTIDGKKVKWNKFYRSDRLCDLTDNDLKYLGNLNLKTVLDYRSAQEANYEKDKSIYNAQYINVSAMPMDDKFNGNLDMHYLLKHGSSLFSKKANPIDFLADSYKNMVFNNEAFKKLIEILKEDDDRAFVQHCKSGKDRTGIGSALVLLLLGVPMEKVKEDYLASNIYRKNYNDSTLEKYKAYLDNDEKIALFKVIMEVKEEYFDSAFNTIFEKYDSIEKYFESEFNLTSEDIIKLKSKYLY